MFSIDGFTLTAEQVVTVARNPESKVALADSARAAGKPRSHRSQLDAR